jgi:hypothetical protein
MIPPMSLTKELFIAAVAVCALIAFMSPSQAATEKSVPGATFAESAAV